VTPVPPDPTLISVWDAGLDAGSIALGQGYDSASGQVMASDCVSPLNNYDGSENDSQYALSRVTYGIHLARAAEQTSLMTIRASVVLTFLEVQGAPMRLSAKASPLLASGSASFAAACGDHYIQALELGAEADLLSILQLPPNGLMPGFSDVDLGETPADLQYFSSSLEALGGMLSTYRILDKEWNYTLGVDGSGPSFTAGTTDAAASLEAYSAFAKALPRSAYTIVGFRLAPYPH
jgi:hypothetical protein